MGTSPSSPTPLLKFDNLLSLQATYLTLPQQTVRLTDLLSQNDDRRTLSMSAASSLFRGKLTGEGELAFSPPGSHTMEGRGDPRRRLMRLGVTGTKGRFRYGLNFRDAGKAVTVAPDQAMREVWGEWHLGIARLRTAIGETWNNVEKDPLRARVAQTYERITVALARPSWPELSLSYGRIAVASSLEPAGVIPVRQGIDALESAVAYAEADWNARASATYLSTSDLFTSGLQTVGIAYALMGTYRPNPQLTIIPSVSLRDDLRRWSRIHVNSRAASLSVTYTPGPHFALTTATMYGTTVSSDRLVDLTTFTTKSTFTWTALSIARFQTSISLEASHRLSQDPVNPALSVEDTAGFIRLQLAGS